MFYPEEIIQKERERRATRVMLVFALIGLVIGAAIFVGLLAISTRLRADSARAWALKTESQANELKARLDRGEPRARLDKAALKAAWDEDCAVVSGRVFLSSVLEQLGKYKPDHGQFWYSEIAITLPPETLGENPKLSPLLASRELRGSGYLQIVGDDKESQEELAQGGRGLSENAEVTRVVGVPTFEINFEETVKMPDPKSGRYARFIIRSRRD